MYIDPWKKEERERSVAYVAVIHCICLEAQSATLLSLSLPYLFFCPSFSAFPPFCFIGACLTPSRNQIVPRSQSVRWTSFIRADRVFPHSELLLWSYYIYYFSSDKITPPCLVSVRVDPRFTNCVRLYLLISNILFIFWVRIIVTKFRLCFGDSPIETNLLSISYQKTPLG